MHTYIFLGKVHPETSCINADEIHIQSDEAVDRAAGHVAFHIHESKIFARFDTAPVLTPVQIATARNIIEDAASNLCNVASVVQGAWTTAAIHTCVGPDHKVVQRFTGIADNLKVAFESAGVTSERLLAITFRPRGYFLRQAIADINAGLLNSKLFRTNTFRAIEALRNSVQNTGNKEADWPAFRAALGGLRREDIELFEHHAERHGDYENAQIRYAEDVDRGFEILALIMARYLDWAEAHLT